MTNQLVSAPDVFQDVPIDELADWMRGHPGGRIAVFSIHCWGSAWQAALDALNPETCTIVNARGERIERPNGAIAKVLPLKPWGDAFRGYEFDALCIVDGCWSDLTQRQKETVYPSLIGHRRA